MAGFTFQIAGLDKVISVFDKLPKQTQTELSSELEITAHEIMNGAKRDAPVDEGRVKNSISTQKVNVSTYSVVAQDKHAGYLEFGTKTKVRIPAGLEAVAAQLKGPVPSSATPIDALEGWVKRKGLSGKNSRQTAWAVWRHISRYGINAQPFFFTQMAPAESRLRKRIANIIKNLV